MIKDEAQPRQLRSILPALIAVLVGLILVSFAYGGKEETEITPTPGTTFASVVLATQTLTSRRWTPSVQNSNDRSC